MKICDIYAIVTPKAGQYRIQQDADKFPEIGLKMLNLGGDLNLATIEVSEDEGVEDSIFVGGYNKHKEGFSRRGVFRIKDLGKFMVLERGLDLKHVQCITSPVASDVDAAIDDAIAHGGDEVKGGLMPVLPLHLNIPTPDTIAPFYTEELGTDIDAYLQLHDYTLTFYPVPAGEIPAGAFDGNKVYIPIHPETSMRGFFKILEACQKEFITVAYTMSAYTCVERQISLLGREDPLKNIKINEYNFVANSDTAKEALDKAKDKIEDMYVDSEVDLDKVYTAEEWFSGEEKKAILDESVELGLDMMVEKQKSRARDSKCKVVGLRTYLESLYN